jgi:hypothetical protein
MNSSMELYTFDYVQRPFDNVVTEVVYPFGNYQARFMSKFCIAVHSPSQFYYSDIFGSFILNSDQAYRLYYLLLTEQQVDVTNATPDNILSSIPDHLATLELQFKKFYELAYYNVITKINYDTISEVFNPSQPKQTKIHSHDNGKKILPNSPTPNPK